jgi:hypothetical protein
MEGQGIHINFSCGNLLGDGPFKADERDGRIALR